MASAAEITVKLDPREVVLSIERAMAMLAPKPVVSPSSLLVAAAVASKSSRKVTRRSLLGLGWRRG